jgi:hypothetical protein
MESLPDPEPFEIGTTPTDTIPTGGDPVIPEEDDTESETEEAFIARGGIREEADRSRSCLDLVGRLSW